MLQALMYGKSLIVVLSTVLSGESLRQKKKSLSSPHSAS